MDIVCRISDFYIIKDNELWKAHAKNQQLMTTYMPKAFGTSYYNGMASECWLHMWPYKCQSRSTTTIILKLAVILPVFLKNNFVISRMQHWVITPVHDNKKFLSWFENKVVKVHFRQHFFFSHSIEVFEIIQLFIIICLYNLI